MNDPECLNIDLETMYVEHAKANFDFDAIEKSGLKFAYDAMFGAGQNAVKRLKIYRVSTIILSFIWFLFSILASGS